ncbi:hypothetical protein HPB49_014580 [Dermacentor silvarum]|uniref:Uncharacterized protein n=1 Tax=Dermacentor silvarum TaxID=543639 RepID=A0ACB8DJG8_DERSI|nr:hypothetical protein HPB49_014580 [Dermacentor silvarum]
MFAKKCFAFKTARVESDSGGICETYRHAVVKKKLDAYDGPLSLNTAVVTFQNHNGRVPQRTSHITFAHELGHNFGSSHDPEPECAPGGSQGNYIMYADAQPGVDPNNRKFSPCSIANITIILRRLFSGEGTRDNCLQAPRGPFCGNTIREGDEQCDCGYTPSECRDRCCRPRRHAKPCTLAPDARCSGRRAECPLAAPKPDGTPCNRGTQLCRSGECRLSVCRRYHLEPCFLTGRFVTSADQCLIACREPGE